MKRIGASLRPTEHMLSYQTIDALAIECADGIGIVGVQPHKRTLDRAVLRQILSDQSLLMHVLMLPR